jgi:hypothetical protein
MGTVEGFIKEVEKAVKDMVEAAVMVEFAGPSRVC